MKHFRLIQLGDVYYVQQKIWWWWRNKGNYSNLHHAQQLFDELNVGPTEMKVLAETKFKNSSSPKRVVSDNPADDPL